MIGLECFHGFETTHANQQLTEKAQAYAYYWHQSVFETFN